MLKLPLGSAVYNKNGNEYTVAKNGRKYITISNHQGYEYKCVWEENKLVSKDSYSSVTFYTKSELDKHNKLQEVEKVIYAIKKEFDYFYKIESELETLKSLLEDALNKINQYENIENRGE